MDKLKNIFLLSLLFVSVPFTSTQASFLDDFYLNPYVAAEAAYRHFPWETQFGENHFREHFPNANFVFGVQVHDYIAVEGGYQTTDRRDMTQFYFAGNGVPPQQAVLGFLARPGLEDPSMHISQAEVNGWHLNLVGLWPVLDRTTLYASLGAAWMRFYVNTVPVYNLANTAANPVRRWHSDRDTVFRFSLGVKQFITDHFGARVFFTYEGTSGMEGIIAGHGFEAGVPAPDRATDFYKAESKGSFLFGLGFFYQLCPNRNA